MPIVPGTAVVSRALSIIGSAYADYLATNGYDLVLIDHFRPRLNALAEELTTRTRRAVEVVVVDRESAVDQAMIEAKIEEDASVVLVVNVTDESGYALLSVEQANALIDRIAPDCAITCTALRKFSSKSDGVSVCGAGVLITAAGHIADFPRLI
jgi:short-subunit dehydrogenase